MKRLRASVTEVGTATIEFAPSSLKDGKHYASIIIAGDSKLDVDMLYNFVQTCVEQAHREAVAEIEKDRRKRQTILEKFPTMKVKTRVI